MLLNYLPIYKIALRLQDQLSTAEVLKSTAIHDHAGSDFRILLEEIQQVCLRYALIHTSDLARYVASEPLPKKYEEMATVLKLLNHSLSNELEQESIFRIPPDRKRYFEMDDAFGPETAVAFPSCARDIRKAGSCYSLEQEDACVHHLMLVLERGLNALARKLGLPFQPAGWQNIINSIGGQLKSMPKGDPNRDFYVEVTAQFGFLKNAYRNHSEHAHDDPYDMGKALSIYNHVRAFMQELEKGGLTE